MLKYIHPKKLKWAGVKPPASKREDVVLGVYYNILAPQEHDAEARLKFYAWLSAHEPHKPFPLSHDELFLLSPAICKTIAYKAYYGQLAQELKKRLREGISFERALEASLEVIEKKIAPLYLQYSSYFKKSEAQVTHPSLKARFRKLALSLEACGVMPRKALNYAIKKYQVVQGKPAQLDALLTGSIEKAQGQRLAKRDYWQQRRVPLLEMFHATLATFPKAPFFFALQEVTPYSLEKLKEGFGKEVQWVSFNNISHLPTKFLEPHQETVLGEAGALTATIALSPELKVRRKKLGDLPSCSGNSCTILGIEVENEKTGGRFAIFSIHADYMVEEDLYAKTAHSVGVFIEKFIGKRSLPFIFGGDFNAFEGMGGEEYLQNIQKQKMLSQACDFREGLFYAPQEILDATFIGHMRDDYKMTLDEEGRVQPNALDHIFLTPKKLFGFRQAGVYDDAGHLIDPEKSPQLFQKHLKERHTTSDHFLNGVLFISP